MKKPMLAHGTLPSRRNGDGVAPLADERARAWRWPGRDASLRAASVWRGSTMPDQRDWLAAVLRGELAPWPFGCDPVDCDAVLLVAEAQGVSALLLSRLARVADADRLPSALRPALRQRVRREATAEFSREIECVRVLGLLAAADLRPLLMKGTALAYSIYPEPHWRSRCDTDLLFSDPAAARRAGEVLAREGYWRANAVSGEFISRQCSWYGKDRFGVAQTWDLHWAASNVHPFAAALPFAELDAGARPLPRLGPHARGLAPVHALLLACLHRVGHAFEGLSDRLIWTYDIHLLMAGFTDADWSAFADLAIQRGVGGIALAGLGAGRLTFGSAAPSRVLEALAVAAASEWLTPERFATKRAMVIANLRGLDDWRSRRRMVWEILFPDADYMLKKYDTNQRWRLPFLYLARIFGPLRGHWRP